MNGLWRKACTALLGMAVLAACSETDDEPYPAIVTEMADIASDTGGRLVRFVTDGGLVYRITNTLSGYEPQSVYRVVCGYVPQNDEATIYQLSGVEMLRDSTARPVHDPTGVQSVWRGGQYINLHLTPRTQGGKQYWGYAVDSLRPGHVFLSLHHRQNNDPTSYTEHVYASIYLPNITNYNEGDSITLTIETFNGKQVWTIKDP